MQIRIRRQGRLATVALALLSATLWAHAQPPDAGAAGVNPRQCHFQGYVFGAPGAYAGYSETMATMHVGVGGEGLVFKGLGLGAEAGVLWAVQGSDALGLLSVDGSYHFSRNRKLSPFLTGGYSLIGGNGRRSLVNIGGGANWWLGERTGVRFELREPAYADDSNRHIFKARVGFVFR